MIEIVMALITFIALSLVIRDIIQNKHINPSTDQVKLLQAEIKYLKSNLSNSHRLIKTYAKILNKEEN